jgi:rhodanese-related sulfurtransferase
MRGGLTASDLADLELAYAPQFGSAKDPVNMLGMIADNLSGGERTAQWHEVERAIEDGTTLVDVRSPLEFADGAIPKAVNIPLEELRLRAAEIPAGPVIVTCAVGQRGHTATRLLSQLGRDMANLDGGYRTWVAGGLR